jgi:predicted esterase
MAFAVELRSNEPAGGESCRGTPTNATQLASMLQAAGAKVEHHTLPTGHELSQADITLARRWLAAR